MPSVGQPAAASSPADQADAAVDDLADRLRIAEDLNAEGSPARAAAILEPLLESAAALPPGPGTFRLRARVLLELAKSRFEVHGQADDVLAELDDLVVSAAAGAGTGWRGLVPAVAGLRGLLALRAGRHEEALRRLDLAVGSIDDAEPLDACRALLNRGVLHAERHEVPAARSDYLECIRLARTAGLERLRSRAEFNLGHLEYVSGRLPSALARMDAAAASMQPTPPTVLLDRARVLLEAGLVAVADAALSAAAEQFAAQGLAREVAECEITRAECAILRGDLTLAKQLTRSAARRARRRRDETALVRAQVLELQVGAAALGDPRRSAPASAAEWSELGRRAAQVEDLCARTGRPSWRTESTYVRIESELARGVCADPRAVLAGLGQVRATDPLPVRLHGRRIRALLALTAGERQRAERQVWAGQRDLRLHRARFGSLDLRTAGAVHGSALADLDLRIALSSGRPGAVLDAIERTRAVMGVNPRVNPPDDPATAALLTDLRRAIDVHAELALRPRSDPERVRFFREVAALKHEILARSWREPGRVAADRAGRSARVAGALAQRPGTVLLDVADLGGELVAVRVDRTGTTLLRLGPGARAQEAVRRVRADLEVVANPLVPAALRTAARRSADTSLAVLESVFTAALPPADELVIVAGGWLGAVPWALLPGRRGRATVQSGSVGHWLRHCAIPLGARPEVRVGAGPGLAHAEDEAKAVADIWPGAQVTVGQDATVAHAAAMLAGGGIVHLAAHGRHEPDNPLFSSIRFADGPLFAHELDTGGPVPDLVVLSCCEVGRSSVRSGGESLGMANVLLRSGVGSVVAAIAPLPDATALRVMTGLHHGLRAGRPVAAALAAATAEEADASGELVPLVCLGTSP